MQWLLVKNEVIENIVVWDGVTSWTPPEGYELVRYGGDLLAKIGDGWVNGQLIIPPEPEPASQEAPTIID